MYLNSETQTRVMEPLLLSRLNESGFLVLGKAEMLFTQPALVHPGGPQAAGVREGHSDDDAGERLILRRIEYGAGSISNHVAGKRESAFELGPVGQVVVDAHGLLVQANARARDLFGILAQRRRPPAPGPRALLPPRRSCGPHLQAAADRAQDHPVAATCSGSSDGEPRYLDIQVIPMLAAWATTQTTGCVRSASHDLALRLWGVVRASGIVGGTVHRASSERQA